MLIKRRRKTFISKIYEVTIILFDIISNSPPYPEHYNGKKLYFFFRFLLIVIKFIFIIRKTTYTSKIYTTQIRRIYFGFLARISTNLH